MSGIPDCRGTLYLCESAGRALRKRVAAIRAVDVLYWGGKFSAGDTVYVAFATIDGSQFVVATGVILCDEAELRAHVGSNTVDDWHGGARSKVIIEEQGLSVLWS